MKKVVVISYITTAPIAKARAKAERLTQELNADPAIKLAAIDDFRKARPLR